MLAAEASELELGAKALVGDDVAELVLGAWSVVLDGLPPSEMVTGRAVIVVTYGIPVEGYTVVVYCRAMVLVMNIVVVEVMSGPAPK